MHSEKIRRGVKSRNSPHSVTFSVPATTANLGPGFDSFGLALDAANLVTVTEGNRKPPASPMVVETGHAFFNGSAISPFPFSWKIRGPVPRSRGLGSSVTVRLGVLLGLNRLSGSPLSKEGLLRLCTVLEGHPDNAAPAMLGGFTVARAHKPPLRYKVSDQIRFVLLIPDFEVATPDARKVMPRSVSIADAAANASDAAVIAAAFATRRYDLLQGSFGDRLHQPHRMKLVPFLNAVIEAGERAGAMGGWLSGSGSTICCIAPDAKAAAKVARAMRTAAPRHSRTMICKADNKGARLIE
jgi:homoserine kinase